MSSLPYVVIVSDGLSIRTLHPPVFGADRAALEAIVGRVLGSKSVTVTDLATANAPLAQTDFPAGGKFTGAGKVAAGGKVSAASTSTMVQAEIAVASGYSGNACASCGGFSMRRTGTCETCEGCGSTSGGCS